MLEIGDTIVSFDLFEQQFCCDLGVCKGQCCIEGDAGAPLETDEIAEIEEVLPIIWDNLSAEAKAVIDEQGIAYVDIEGDLVTSIVNHRECVFSYIDKADGICKCAIEKAFHDGKTTFLKPVSCHLYPVRVKKFKDFMGVAYHRWNVCECAEKKGHALKVPVYKFLKVPLTRRFGEAWYAELEEAAKAYEAEFHKQ